MTSPAVERAQFSLSLPNTPTTHTFPHTDAMRTLVVLAVMVAVSTHQACSTPTYGSPGPAYGSHSHGGGGGGHGSHAHGYGQPRYVGPLASSVPAGLGGKVIPVSNTYEVEAARGEFFKTYQNQLNTLQAIRASRPSRYGQTSYDYAPQPSYGSAGPVYSPPAVHVPHSTYGAPSHGYSGAPVQVRDTPEVAAAKAQFFHLFNKQAAAAAAAPDHYTHNSHY